MGGFDSAFTVGNVAVTGDGTIEVTVAAAPVVAVDVPVVAAAGPVVAAAGAAVVAPTGAVTGTLGSVTFAGSGRVSAAGCGVTAGIAVPLIDSGIADGRNTRTAAIATSAAAPTAQTITGLSGRLVAAVKLSSRLGNGTSACVVDSINRPSSACLL